ncbi:MAG: pilus assembly protein PilM [Bacillota bacterium]|nr:pilus assembly protein PilM [Bacillota bacterium]
MAIKEAKKDKTSVTFKSRGRYSPIGLDIGSGAIKMIQLKLTSGRIAVNNAALLKTPPQSVNNGAVTDPELISSLLAGLKKNDRWFGRKINLSLNSPVFYLRRLKMPPMKRSEMKSAMRLAVEKYFPLPCEELVFDYCIAENNNYHNNTECDYYLAAAPLDCAVSYTTAVERAGFQAAALEIGPFSLLRFLNFNRPANMNPADKNNLQLLADIGAAGTSFLVTSEGSLHYYRYFKTGFKDFLHAAAEKAKTMGSRVENIFFSSASLAERGLLTPAEELAVQIIQSFTYWSDQSDRFNFQDNERPLLWLCGGGAVIPGISAYLRNMTALPTRILDSFAGIPCRNGELSTRVKKRNCLFSTALGLAFRGWLI